MPDNLTLIITFFANTTTGIFAALDSVYIGSYSVLDIFVGLAFFELFLWFIMKILRKNEDEEK